MLKDIAAEGSCLTYNIRVCANSVNFFIIVIRHLLTIYRYCITINLVVSFPFLMKKNL